MKKEQKSSSWKSPNKLVLCKYLLSVMSSRSVDWPKQIISLYLQTHTLLQQGKFFYIQNILTRVKRSIQYMQRIDTIEYIETYTLHKTRHFTSMSCNQYNHPQKSLKHNLKNSKYLINLYIYTSIILEIDLQKKLVFEMKLF